MSSGLPWGDERSGYRIRDDRGCARGHSRGQVRRGRRRGRPRERRRSDDRSAVCDARGDRVHGEGGARAHLPLPDRRALRRVGASSDERPQRDAVRDRVHGVDRGARRDQHGHLGARPRAHDPGCDRPVEGSRGSRRAGARVSAARAAGRRARAHRSDRGSRRPCAARRPELGRRDLRGDEGRRHDGARPRSDRVLRGARDQARHRRRPDRVPPPARASRRARDRRSFADSRMASSPPCCSRRR